MSGRHPVVVVGGGIAGVACARELVAAGLPVRVLDRGLRLGGRMARWTRDGRAVDIGAAYFTVTGEAFRAVVEGWAGRGLAHPWTDTFHVAEGTVVTGTTAGPVRWSSEDGLRSLVEDLAAGLPVEYPVAVREVARGSAEVGSLDAPLLVDGQPASAVVLAVPEPQALDILAPGLLAPADAASLAAAVWEASVMVAAAFAHRTWLPVDGLFVNDSPTLSLVVDDGRRRGDHAPVLVARTAPALAAVSPDDPGAVVPVVLEALHRLLGIAADPVWVEAKRWGLATPVNARTERFLLTDDLVGLCGDAWSTKPRVEAAFESGVALGRALADRLVG